MVVSLYGAKLGSQRKGGLYSCQRSKRGWPCGRGGHYTDTLKGNGFRQELKFVQYLISKTQRLSVNEERRKERKQVKKEEEKEVDEEERENEKEKK